MSLNYTGADLPFFCDVIGSTLGHPGFSFSPSFGTAVKQTAGWVGGWDYSIFDNVGTGTAYYGDRSQINDGSWHSLVYIIDHANGVSVYVDGVLAHQNVPPGGGGGSIPGSGKHQQHERGDNWPGPNRPVSPGQPGGLFGIDDLGAGTERLPLWRPRRFSRRAA